MPLGVSGVITMKIIRSTSKISISGTTFISATAPPLLLPTLIPIASLQSVPNPARVCNRCHHLPQGLQVQTLETFISSRFVSTTLETFISSRFVSTNPETFISSRFVSTNPETFISSGFVSTNPETFISSGFVSTKPETFISSGFVSTNPETRQRIIQLNTNCEKRSVAGRRRRRRSSLFRTFGQQTQLIDTGRANLVHDRHHVAVLGARVAFEIDRLVQFVGNAVLHLSGKVSFLDLGIAEEDVAVTSDRNDHCIFLVGFLHVPG